MRQPFWKHHDFHLITTASADVKEWEYGQWMDQIACACPHMWQYACVFMRQNLCDGQNVIIEDTESLWSTECVHWWDSHHYVRWWKRIWLRWSENSLHLRWSLWICWRGQNLRVDACGQNLCDVETESVCWSCGMTYFSMGPKVWDFDIVMIESVCWWDSMRMEQNAFVYRDRIYV